MLPFTQIEPEPGLFEVTVDPGQIAVSHANIGRALGYGEKKMPEHFAGMVGDILARMPSLCAPRAGYRFLDAKIPEDRAEGLYAGGTYFSVKRIVASQLKAAHEVALFVCTIGPGMEQWRRQLELDRDEVLALLVDAVASSAVEAATGMLHDHVQATLLLRGLNVTNRFSPGYCGWPVTDQQQLFSKFPKGFCGITLTESSLMMPIKSVSGIIGIGEKAARKDYPCNRCDRSLCIYRSYRKG
jgi:hypothetical protein